MQLVSMIIVVCFLTLTLKACSGDGLDIRYNQQCYKLKLNDQVQWYKAKCKKK